MLSLNRGPHLSDASPTSRREEDGLRSRICHRLAPIDPGYCVVFTPGACPCKKTDTTPDLAPLIYTALLALGSPAVWISPKQSVPAAAIDAQRNRTGLQNRPPSSTLPWGSHKRRSLFLPLSLSLYLLLIAAGSSQEDRSLLSSCTPRPRPLRPLQALVSSWWASTSSRALPVEFRARIRRFGEVRWAPAMAPPCRHCAGGQFPPTDELETTWIKKKGGEEAPQPN